MDTSNAEFEAMARFTRGLDPWVVMVGMVEDGFDPDEAHAAVEGVQRRMARDDRRRGLANLVSGLSIFALCLFFGGWMASSPGRATVIGVTVIVLSVLWGLIGFVRAVDGIRLIVSAGRNPTLAKL